VGKPSRVLTKVRVAVLAVATLVCQRLSTTSRTLVCVQDEVGHPLWGCSYLVFTAHFIVLTIGPVTYACCLSFTATSLQPQGGLNLAGYCNVTIRGMRGGGPMTDLEVHIIIRSFRQSQPGPRVVVVKMKSLSIRTQTHAHAVQTSEA
jgi:hypothetical protein